MSEAQELIVIPKESAMQVFTTPGSIDTYLEQIKAAVTGIVPDLSTKKGRDSLASLAYKVAKSKTYLDGVGKELVDELKKQPALIDATRKRARDFLDQLKDEVRRPLTEWEAEQQRIQSVIDTMANAHKLEPERTAAEIDQTITYLETLDLAGKNLGERLAEAEQAKAASLEVLRQQYAKRKQYEDEQAELAELRRLNAEREQKEREQRIAAEAAERAQREAQEAAERKVQEAEQAAQRAEQERLQAEERAAKAERDAKARAEQAAEQERQRIAEEQRQAEHEAKAREADREHRRKVNTAALDALINEGVPLEQAKLVITAIAQRRIPAVHISY